MKFHMIMLRNEYDDCAHEMQMPNAMLNTGVLQAVGLSGPKASCHVHLLPCVHICHLFAYFFIYFLIQIILQAQVELGEL